MHMPGLQPQKKRSTSFIDHYFPRYKKNKTTGADDVIDQEDNFEIFDTDETGDEEIEEDLLVHI